MKIFDFSKLAYSVAKGKIVKLNGGLCIPQPTISNGCPNIKIGAYIGELPADGKKYPRIGEGSQIPAKGYKKYKISVPNNCDPFLGIYVFGTESDAKNETGYWFDIEFKTGTYEYEVALPFFEIYQQDTYYFRTYNSNSGEGGQLLMGNATKLSIKSCSDNPVDPYTQSKPSITNVKSQISDYELYMEIFCTMSNSTQNIELYIDGELYDTVEADNTIDIPAEYDTKYNLSIRGINGNGNYSQMSDTYIYQTESDPFVNAKPRINVNTSEYGDSIYVYTWLAEYVIDEFECYVDDILKETSSDGEFYLYLDRGTHSIKTRAKNSKGKYSQFSDVETVTID